MTLMQSILEKCISANTNILSNVFLKINFNNLQFLSIEQHNRYISFYKSFLGLIYNFLFPSLIFIKNICIADRDETKLAIKLSMKIFITSNVNICLDIFGWEKS